MLLSRRKLLKAAAAQALILPALKLPVWAVDDLTLSHYLLCAKNPKGQYVAVKITENGDIEQQFTLADRGHGHAKSQNGDIAIFARRPNNQLYLIDKDGQMQVIYAPEGRHFFGHGIFSPDAKLLYCSENDFDHEDPDATGVIGVWDVKAGTKIGEFSSGGIGVHQLVLMADGETLVVANGGILTHPDNPRQKLNLIDMQPNLAFINRKNGHIFNQLSLPHELHQLSIRHLDVTAKGQVAIAMQYQGDMSDNVPLLATIGGNKSLKFTQMPLENLQKNRQYIGSICFDTSGEFFAASSPRGNLVNFFSQNGQFLNQISLVDVCALAPSGTKNEFIIATGTGEICRYNVAKNQLKKLRLKSSKADLYQWDNHMLAL